MRTYRLAPWLWYIVAALHSVLLVCDIMAGTPTFEHEALMMLALVLARVDVMSGRW
jgi:hypothetical protein